MALSTGLVTQTCQQPTRCSLPPKVSQVCCLRQTFLYIQRWAVVQALSVPAHERVLLSAASHYAMYAAGAALSSQVTWAILHLPLVFFIRYLATV